MLLGNVINADSMYSNFSGSQRVVTVETSSSYTPTTSPYSPPASPPAPTYGKSLGVNVLDSRTVVLSSDYNYAYVQQYYIDFESDLIAWDNGDGGSNLMKLNYNHNFRWYYAPYLWQDKYHFTHSEYWSGKTDLTVSADLTITSLNYHASDSDLIHLYGVVSGVPIAMVMNPDIHFSAYLTVSPNLISGHSYKFTNTENIAITLNWNEDTSISRMIKVNHIGYKTSSNAKYCYLGACVFNNSQYDVLSYVGTTYNVVSSPSGTVVFSGTWEVNALDYRVSPAVQTSQGWAHGEDTLEGNFSALVTPGIYYIQADNIGRSFDFEITGNPYILPTIHALRTLYYQTCMPAVVPYVPTAFIHDQPILICKQGQYVAEGNYNYNYNDGYGLILESTGLNLATSYWDSEKEIQAWQQTMINLGRDCPTINNFWGGLKDANDTDQRRYHFGVVAALVSAQTIKPRYCPDGVLKIPSSNNGIDDDIDLINYCLRAWAFAQDSFGTGGVGLWINRPTNGDTYYASHPTLADSMTAAIYFAKYALCVSEIYPTSGIVTEFSTRALNAYNYAINDANRYTVTWNMTVSGSVQVVRYVEPPIGHVKSWDNTDQFLAAAYLYELSLGGYAPSESYFLAIALSKQDLVSSTAAGTETFVGFYGNGTNWVDLYQTEHWPTFNERYRYKIEFCDDYWKANSAVEAYHRPMQAKTASNWDTMSWGSGLGSSKSMVEIALDFIDSHDGITNTHSITIVEHCSNIMLGANEQGDSQLLGVGDSYPMSMRLNFHNYSGYAEHIPGYVRYQNTGTIAVESVELELGLFHEASSYGQPYNIAISFLNPAFETATINAINNFNISAIDYAIKKGTSTGYNYGVIDLAYPLIPIFRRDFVNIADEGVNEFTVNETLSPTILMFVSLLDGALPVLPTADIVYTPKAGRHEIPFSCFRTP
jgi:hypothetical protein